MADLEQRWRERRERSRRELGSWSVGRVMVTLLGAAAAASAVSAIIGQDTLGSISALAGVLGGLGLVWALVVAAVGLLLIAWSLERRPA